MVSEVVAPEKLIDRAIELGEQLAGQSAFAMAKIRQLIIQNTNATDMWPSSGPKRAPAAAYRSWEHKEAIDAFLTKRPADFTKQAGTPVN
jgi:enoyl-CoA hydratase/carnithine racemase